MCGIFSLAQNQISKYALHGRITDRSSGESLSRSSIYIVEQKSGIVADEEGYFSLSFKTPGIYTVQISHIGFENRTLRVPVSGSHTLDIDLNSNAFLKEIIVTGKNSSDNIARPNLGVERLSISQIRKLPSFMGEVDLMKAIQLLPGVHAGNEGSTGFSVRGGNPDQNLVLLDNTTVYNASHLMGFFSIFNNDVISDLELYKGDIPVKYGGRLSSLLDIRTIDRMPERLTATGGIGLISSRLVLQGPIGEKTSWLIGGRRSYADMMIKLSGDKSLEELVLYFYDLNAKISHRLSSRDFLSFNAYYGRDNFGVDVFGVNYGNTAASLTLTHTFSDKLYGKYSVNFSNYNYGVLTDIEGARIQWDASLHDLMLRTDYSHYINKYLDFSYGLTATFHRFVPGNVETPDYGKYTIPRNLAMEHAVYWSNQQELSDKLVLRYGLRWTMFHNIGEATVYRYNENDVVADSVTYKSGQIYNSFNAIEPRVGLIYKFSQSSSFKANYARNVQFIQLANSSSSGSPLDIWFFSGPNVKPQQVDMVSAGYFQNLMNNTLEASLEVYYKQMNNVIDFKDHADLILNKQLEKELRIGKGKAYGIELMVKKNSGRINGFVNYTYSHAERTIPGINDGKTYLSPYDKPHNLKIALNYELSDKFSLSATWIYTTGSPITYPSGRFGIKNEYFPIYSGRNDSRRPDYHRLDLSFNYKPNPKSAKRWKSEWNISIYNAYDRNNPYMITYGYDHKSGIPYAESTYLFGVLPSITYNFKF